MPGTKFVERRSGPSSGYGALMAMVEQMNSNVADLRTELADGMTVQRLALKDSIADAFPEADPVGHRRHHEAVIKAAEERAEFWKTMRVKLASWGLIGFSAWAFYALWQAFLQGPQK